MKIPPKLLEKLKDTQLCDPVKDTVSDFTEWFKFSGTIFFREYTDHGNDHVTEVCRSMTKLITPASWEYITPADCAAIILSALLHDCAMHLTEDGFLELLENKNTVSPLTGASAPDWSELWLDYKRECKRWDDSKWNEVTGLKDPVNELPDNSIRWTSQHHRWIGEFVRRHHADIAYYIARYGLPGPDDERLQLERIDKNLADIVGFIARSHNYPMRESVDLLKKSRKKKQLTESNVHIPYIMGLLRVADYLEIKPNRAPKVVSFRCRTLRSPLSEQEWLNHQAVHDIKIHVRDREALAVEAKPEDVTTYLRLKTLLENIQEELDETWATWGEVYSRDEKLKNLGILYRRIRSNMDDVEEFGKTIDYIPAHAKFKTSDGELLKLLIGPLYGEKPEFGVRELIQNAVDACLERDSYLKQHPELKPAFSNLQDDADVLVTLIENEDGSGILTIEDTGVGMTSDTVRNYFLTAGASHRASNEWQEMHTENGNSQVLRTGRFGIGLLAAFLLGDEIEVETRYIDADNEEGIKFKCTLQSSIIELKRSHCSVGTSVKILVNQERFSELIEQDMESHFSLGSNWDWYTGKSPKLIRRVKLISTRSEHQEQDKDQQGYQILKQQFKFPLANEKLSFEWRRLKVSHYLDILWTWETYKLTCNNFIIGDADRIYWGSQDYIKPLMYSPNNESPYGFSLNYPSLHIYDHNGDLPINLTRTQLNEPITGELHTSLLRAVCRDFIAALLVKMPSSWENFWQNLLGNSMYGAHFNRYLHPSMHPTALDSEQDWLVIVDNGFTLNEPGIIQWLNTQFITFCHPIRFNETNVSSAPFPRGAGKDAKILHYYDSGSVPDGIVDVTIGNWVSSIFSDALPLKHDDMSEDDDWPRGRITTLTPFTPTQRAILIKCDSAKRTHNQYLKRMHCQQITRDVRLYSTDKYTSSWLEIEYLKSLSSITSEFLIGFWKINPNEVAPIPLSPLAQTWKDIIRQPLIPFDLETRKRELAHAYEELAPEIACWEKGGTYSAARELERQQRQNNT